MLSICYLKYKSLLLTGEAGRDDIPEFNKAKNLKWQSKKNNPPVPQWRGSLPEPSGVSEPVDYFCHLFHREIIEEVARQTHRYVLQHDVTRPLNVTVAEMEQFVGV